VFTVGSAVEKVFIPTSKEVLFMSPSQPLTERQKMILHYIRSSIQERGYPPTLREIGTHMGIKSTNGVNDHLRALERKGYLRRDDMKSRALRPVDLDQEGVVLTETDTVSDTSPANDRADLETEASNNVVEIPILGRVAAGPLSLTSDDCEGKIAFDPNLLRAPDPSEVFALRVKGDSMIEAGIFEGDTLFVRRTSTAERGDIVVARLGEEATVKRYFPEKDYIRLQPENQKLSPILVRHVDALVRGFELLGVVVGLYRSFGPSLPKKHFS